jgi:hypothetical protein
MGVADARSMLSVHMTMQAIAGVANMHSVLPYLLPRSTQIAMVALCVVSVAFMLWFLAGLLLDEKKRRSTRVSIFPTRSTPVVMIRAKAQDRYAVGRGTDGSHPDPILPLPKPAAADVRRRVY